MIKNHARTRIENRIKSVGITVDMAKLDKIGRKYGKGKTYVRIANLNGWKITADGSYGDCITAIVKHGTVQTVMLSDKFQRWNDGKFRVDLIG